MLESLDAATPIDAGPYAAILRQELAANSHNTAKVLQVQMQGAQAHSEALARQQLESMLLHAERSLANEESSRVLSSLFNKFSLLQKIMQTMG